MAEKLYKCKTRHANLARYHLNLLEEVYATGRVDKNVKGPNDQPASNEWVFLCDCKDLSLQCTLFSAFAIEAEGVVLMEVTAKDLLPEAHQRYAFRDRYMRNGRTRRWMDIRCCLEEYLPKVGATFPNFRQEDGTDELQDLMAQRNGYAHGKPRQDRDSPTYWHLNS